MKDRSLFTDRDRELLNDIPSDQLSIDRVRDRILAEASRPAPVRPLIPAALAMAVVAFGLAPFAYRSVVDRPSVPTVASETPAMESAPVTKKANVAINKPTPKVVTIPVPVPTAPAAADTAAPVRSERRYRSARPSRRPVAPPVTAVAPPVVEDAPAPKGPVARPVPTFDSGLVASRAAPVLKDEALPEETVVVLEAPVRPGGPSVAIEQEATAGLDIGG